MRLPTSFNAAILFLAVAAGLAASGEAPPQHALYEGADGPFEVESVANTVLRDEKRKKDLPVSACFPKADAAGRLPVVVFSHGAGGSGDRGLPLVSHWASRGYAVLCPTHADSIVLRRRLGQDVSGGIAGLIHRAITQEEGWVNRPADISFLLDSLDALEEKLPALKGRLDRARIGVGGHSFGAFTAQAIGGATLKLAGRDEPLSLADPRPKAILLLSGQGRGQMGLHDGSWDALRRPMMCITGSLDRGAKGQPPEWRREPFDLAPPGDKFLLFIQGAHHGSFTGNAAEGGGLLALLRPAGGGQKAIFHWVKAATTAFWDAFLKGDAAAARFLASDALHAASRNQAKLERR